MTNKSSIQFYFDEEKDGNIKKRLEQVGKQKWDPSLDLSISQIAKALLLEKLAEEEENVPIELPKRDKSSSS